jgi:predicted metal-binding membrane protein
MPDSVIARTLDRDRLIVLTGLVGATVLAWLWIVPMSFDMYGAMSGSSAWMTTPEWDARYVARLFGMWAVMMTGMMLPSSAPMVLLFTQIVRQSDLSRPVIRAYAFAAGYLFVWSLFAVAAVMVQRALVGALALTPMMTLSSNRAASAVLALAGLYQLTPLKRVCLSSCQSPLTFVARHWRNGLVGAFRMGLAHGVFCLGCCWALMLLLFAGGVMHLTTLGLLTIVVLIEKALPSDSRFQWFTWATGSLLLVLAVWMLV